MATTFAVPDGRVAMAATLYTGNGTAQTVNNAVNGISFTPDMVWNKGRSVAYNHNLVDVIRGNSNVIFSNTTDAEQNPGAQLDITTNGFISTYRSANLANNQSAATYVGWQWKAGGTVTAGNNTVGTITSTVSANTTAGFSVVTYTGNGTGGATIGHGVQVGGVATAPSFIIVKNRSTTATDWECYQITLGNTYRIRLNRAFAADTGGALWANTTPTSTVFSVASDLDVNSSGQTYVAYCWAPVAGYSAFGSYTGNGSADGPFIYTGFRPRWLMIKSSTEATSWLVYDSSRNTYNFTGANLRPNLADVEGTQTANLLDFVSNGIKIRGDNTGSINNTQTYIYAAYAENPLKFSNAR